MGGIAALARAAGHRVTGCDSGIYPPMSEQLAALGIAPIEGYGEDQIAIAPDLWVIGNVVSRGNPLMEAILDKGDPYVSGPQWLAEHFLGRKWVLAVAGTHGKTTVSSMLAWILERAGKRPGFLVGGVPADFGISARATDSDLFVIEADEYDTAFFDKRSKFLHYRPRTLVLNNLEFDHADIFDDLGAIERQFHHLVRIVPRSGGILANGSDANLKRVLDKGCWTPVEEFCSREGWYAGEPGAQGAFEVAWQGRVIGQAKLAMPGAHNRANALAAIAAARQVGVDPLVAIEALERFTGVRRRLQLRGISGGIAVYDDFAHHPTAIRATLNAMRKELPGGRILAVFEPRSNTMKKGVMKDALPGSFAAADRVYVHTAGIAWDAEQVFASIKNRVLCEERLDRLISEIAAEARPGDRVLVMSNGSFGGIHEKLLAAFDRP